MAETSAEGTELTHSESSDISTSQSGKVANGQTENIQKNSELAEETNKNNMTSVTTKCVNNETTESNENCVPDAAGVESIPIGNESMTRMILFCHKHFTRSQNF